VRIEEYGIRHAPPPGVARLLAPAPDGEVFALYTTGILRVGDEVRERIELPVDPARALADAMESSPDGTLSLRIGGAGYVRPPGGAWREEGEGPSPHEAIEFQGETWTPTRGRGILRRRHEPYFRPVPLPKGDRIHALALGQDGAIWCGTNEGLAVVRPDGSTEAWSELLGKPLGIVTACAVDREGRVWVGSGSSFTGLYRREKDGWHHLDEIEGHVHRITVDPSGALWFAVLSEDAEPGRGAWCFSDGQFRPAPPNVDLPSARIYDVVARDRRGTLWFATLKGLAAYEGEGRVTYYLPATPDEEPSPILPLEHEEHVLLGEKVWCLCAARDGSLWIGYQQSPGATRLSSDGITNYDVDDGLCDGNVWSIVEGKPGVFWFATGAGLSRYDGLRWSCFRNEEGLGEEGIWPLLPVEDGSLWIGTLGAGLLHLEPRDHTPPKTRFRAPAYEVDAGRPVDVTWTGTDAWYDTPMAELWYRHRLDGGTWSAATAATSLQLAPAPGDHVLEVQAIDRFGNAEDPPARVTIAIAGPSRVPYLAAGAAALALLALGFLVGRAGRARRKRVSGREGS
jgi:streptogramin lyase